MGRLDEGRQDVRHAGQVMTESRLPTNYHDKSAPEWADWALEPLHDVSIMSLSHGRIVRQLTARIETLLDGAFRAGVEAIEREQS